MASGSFQEGLLKAGLPEAHPGRSVVTKGSRNTLLKKLLIHRMLRDLTHRAVILGGNHATHSGCFGDV